MKRWAGSTFTTALLSLTLLVPGAVQGTRAGAHAGPEGIQPVQASTQSPNQRMAVIVQKADSSNAAEELALRLGGTITKRLGFINAFAAEIPAAAFSQLADCPSVRAVTPDSGMQQSGDKVSVTYWASSIGTITPNGFTNAAAMVDSNFGANGTFGSGSKVKGSFGGFNVDVMPGYIIKEVELLVHGYVRARLPGGQDSEVSAVINGVRQDEEGLNHDEFNDFIGPAAAGLVAKKIKKDAGSWAWSDLANLEVHLRQDMFDGTSTIYYDAVGVRIEAEPGTTDPSSYYAIPTEASAGVIDGTRQANSYNAAINATEVWNGDGYLQGNKTVVAIVDSGVVKTKDLKGRNRKNVSFNLADRNGSDLYGHGTFVAGIVAGSGASSAGKYMGVAPKADYVNVRVSDDRGACSESDVVNALQWVYDNHDKYKIRVINLSLNSDTAQSYLTSPLDAACEILWFNGVVVVASAGNNGDATLYPPANDPFVITVGATDDNGTEALTDDAVASFSAYGTSEAGQVKPELVAPGRNIVGLLPENGDLKIGIDHPENRVDATYFRMSGTSISAPMVTGAVALLLQDEPNLTPDQVKYRLMASANKSWPGYIPTKAGAGYLDVSAAVSGTTTSSANTGQVASQILWTGEEPAVWGSVMWRSVMWRSVMWRSVMWRSVMWRSVMWRSDYWE